jgi:hypothetical protein
LAAAADHAQRRHCTDAPGSAQRLRQGRQQALGLGEDLRLGTGQQPQARQPLGQAIRVAVQASTASRAARVRRAARASAGSS